MSLRLALVLGLTLAAMLSLRVDAVDPLRMASMLPFLLLAPGLAWVTVGDRLGVIGYFAVVVSVSVAFNILVATALLFGNLWAAELGFWLLVVAVAVGLFVTDV